MHASALGYGLGLFDAKVFTVSPVPRIVWQLAGIVLAPCDFKFGTSNARKYAKKALDQA